MKKTILATVMVLTMATSFQANALVGGVVALAGGGASLALSGLYIGVGGAAGSFVVGMTAGRGNEGLSTLSSFAALAFLAVGVVILDGENGQEIQFKKIANDDLLKMNLTEDEARGYNENTEELSQAFKIVSSDLTKDSKVEDAKQLWDEQEAILGTDTINGARKVLAHALNK